MIAAQQRLNEHLARWDAAIREYRSAAEEAGEAEVLLDRRRATVKTLARHNDAKLPEWLADTLADEDDEAHQLALKFAKASAVLEELKLRLRWAQAAADSLRSEISTERAEAQLYAGDRSTP